jgi:hypothetical protein
MRESTAIAVLAAAFLALPAPTPHAQSFKATVVINTDTSNKGEAITARQVADLPLNGRNYERRSETRNTSESDTAGLIHCRHRVLRVLRGRTLE